MNNKMMGLILGVVLVIIAIILAIVQHFNIYNFYGDVANKWYFWGGAAIIGIIGIIIAAWSYLKK